MSYETTETGFNGFGGAGIPHAPENVSTSPQLKYNLGIPKNPPKIAPVPGNVVTPQENVVQNAAQGLGAFPEYPGGNPFALFTAAPLTDTTNNFGGNAPDVDNYDLGTLIPDAPATTPVDTSPQDILPVETTPAVEAPVYTTPQAAVYTTPQAALPVETTPTVEAPVYTTPQAASPVETTPEISQPPIEAETTPDTLETNPETVVTTTAGTNPSLSLNMSASSSSSTSTTTTTNYTDDTSPDTSTTSTSNSTKSQQQNGGSGMKPPSSAGSPKSSAPTTPKPKATSGNAQPKTTAGNPAGKAKNNPTVLTTPIDYSTPVNAPIACSSSSISTTTILLVLSGALTVYFLLRK